MKIVVLDGDVINPGDISWAPLEKLGEVAIYGDTPEDLIVERAAGAEVLITNKVPLRSGTLSRLPDLRMVAVLATGYDIIDTADAAAHGIPVCNVVAYGVDDVAQHAWALLLELCRNKLEHDGFRVLTHSLVPPNDGGIALGQAVYGARKLEKEDSRCV